MRPPYTVETHPEGDGLAVMGRQWKVTFYAESSAKIILHG